MLAHAGRHLEKVHSGRAMGMQAVLVMFRSDGERRSFSITRDMTVIGRREDCDLRIPVGDVSRKHCRLVRDGDRLRLEDLGSSNGTFHNGRRVEKDVQLSPGDSIQVGPVVFVLQIDGVPADEELQPVTMEGAATTAAPTDEIAEEAPQELEAVAEENVEDLPSESLEALEGMELDEAGQSGFDVDINAPAESDSGETSVDAQAPRRRK